eukprot:256523-Chlamydomonas_euryale.AAC.1
MQHVHTSPTCAASNPALGPCVVSTPAAAFVPGSHLPWAPVLCPHLQPPLCQVHTCPQTRCRFHTCTSSPADALAVRVMPSLPARQVCSAPSSTVTTSEGSVPSHIALPGAQGVALGVALGVAPDALRTNNCRPTPALRTNYRPRGVESRLGGRARQGSAAQHSCF